MRIPLRDATTLFRFLIYLLVVCLVTEIAFFIMVLTFFWDRSLAATDVGSHPLILLSALGVVSIPFLMQVHPMVLYGAPRLTVADAEPLKGKIKNKVEVKVEEVEDTNAADVEIRFQKLTDEILLIMEEEQLYLQPDFSLEDLAEQMDVPKHHLYYCFSHFLKTKFTRLRTGYRVAHACRLIETGATREKTLEAIGLESGFGNRITFASSFREVKGVSPREYVNVVSARS
jgi:AraC-like DNA-binding protein